MKVIAVDNLDREWISDQLIKENLTEAEANKIADDHNNKINDDDPYSLFYRVVPDDYKLYKFEP